MSFHGSVPDAGVAGNHVGLVAAVGDDVMRALLQAQVLAAIVPGHVHHPTASSALRPRHGAPALCAVSPSNVSTEISPLPPPSPHPVLEPGADVVVEHGVDAVEHPGAHVVRLGAQLFLGHAGPDHDGAGKLLALHHFLHGQRGKDVERRSGVVTFAVAGRARDDLVAIGDAGLLRRLGMPSTSSSAITGRPDP